jgi:hypothetical protein
MNQFNNCNCTYLTPPRFNEVHVPSQKCEQSCIMYVLWVLMLPLFLWLWNCSDRVSFCSLYHTLKMKLALQRIVVAFILYAWIKTYHFKRMKYFYLYVVYKNEIECARRVSWTPFIRYPNIVIMSYYTLPVL